MDIYFILYDSIQSSLFCCWIIANFSVETLLVYSSVPFTHPNYWVFLFIILPYRTFFLSGNIRCSVLILCISGPSPRISHSFNDPLFILLENSIETKIWVLRYTSCSGMFLHLGCFSWQEINACSTYLYIFICITICILNETWLNTDISNSNPLPHRSFYFLPLVYMQLPTPAMKNLDLKFCLPFT